ncbi:MAG: hypothetical protein EPN84_10475 [Legionella sp.]|nr:MAG: hypothetical protein EPN84_10475 [Legionella sp.]
MKLETISSDKRRLIIKQWLLHSLGLLLIIGSVFAVLYLMQEYTIVCKEKQANRAGQCTLETNIFNLYHTSTNLGELELAAVLSKPSKGNTVYFVVLKTSSGLINLTGGSSSGRSEKDTAAEGINSYITQSLETTYKVPYPTPWWYYAFVALFPLIGFGLLAVKGEVIVFDGTQRTVISTKKGLFGGGEAKLSFADIDKIIILEVKGSRGVKSSRLAFALKDKEKPLLIANSYDSQTKVESIAKELNEFIDRYRA